LIPHEIKNLIFDLGGVIINLDTNRTHEAFAKLANCSIEEVKTRTTEQSFFNDYEKGLLTDNEFRVALQSFLNSKVSDAQIDSAWNAMLLDIPNEKYQLLEKLKSNYNLFLLSNTNSIHLDFVNQLVLENTGHPGIGHYFHKDYYSHLMNMRKPDTEIFHRVLLENNLIAKETYFLDDNLDNIHGAKSIGLQTIHIDTPHTLLSLF
jgi:glucose-1-phosphatase